jgi:hypothetical protein
MNFLKVKNQTLSILPGTSPTKLISSPKQSGLLFLIVKLGHLNIGSFFSIFNKHSRLKTKIGNEAQKFKVW